MPYHDGKIRLFMVTSVVVIMNKEARIISALKTLKALLERRQYSNTFALKHQGLKGIKQLGHREYIGGLWNELGTLQFQFLVSQQLKPHHYLLDIACGCLRAGVHLIPYLEPGHYLGIEKEKKLLQAGIEQELGRGLYQEKRPQFVISKKFEFEKFGIAPDYAWAQSLFTHLPASAITVCFAKLRNVIKPNGVFYSTFFETEADIVNPSAPHDHKYFAYTRPQIESFGTENQWQPEYIGDWGHPRGQIIVRYRPV